MIYRLLHIPTGHYVFASFTSQNEVMTRSIGNTEYGRSMLDEFTKPQVEALLENAEYEIGQKHLGFPIFDDGSIGYLRDVSELLVLEFDV